MSDFIVASIVLSVVLTMLLNVGIRLFPDVGERLGEWLHRQLEPDDRPPDPGRSPHVRVVFPWKAMLIASVVLTVIVNLIALVASRP